MEQAIMSTLYVTGVRIRELVTIKLVDIDWEVRSILICEGKGMKDRMVLFTAQCSERLQAYLATHEGPYLFSLEGRYNHVSMDWVREKFQGYSQALKVNRPITPHTIRHTLASELVQKGMPLECIQELFGHEDIRTTQWYAQLNTTAKKKQFEYYQ